MPFSANVTITNTGKNTISNRLVANAAPVPKYIGIGTGATSAARGALPTDTALSTEVETRATGTQSIETQTTTGDTYTVVGTITASSTRAVDEAAIFDATSSGNTFVSATFNPVNLSSGDSIQLTLKSKFQ